MTSDVGIVFVVDDDVRLADSLSRSLRLRGFQVLTFHSAEDFLANYDPGQPGCLILDYGLPEMNGLQLQAHLRSQEYHIPIIFITGHGGVPESVQATKAGALDFLEKPYKPAVLVDRIETALTIDRLNRDRMTVISGLVDAVAQLTDREREIFDLMIARPEIVSSKAIAQELAISHRTVEKHRAQILLKTKCRSVAELIGRYSAAVQASSPADNKLT
jgi:two-component system, LuxR family, response regulator FixJ